MFIKYLRDFCYLQANPGWTVSITIPEQQETLYGTYLVLWFNKGNISVVQLYNSFVLPNRNVCLHHACGNQVSFFLDLWPFCSYVSKHCWSHSPHVLSILSDFLLRASHTLVSLESLDSMSCYTTNRFNLCPG